jgi:hypothetical protein
VRRGFFVAAQHFPAESGVSAVTWPVPSYIRRLSPDSAQDLSIAQILPLFGEPAIDRSAPE